LHTVADLCLRGVCSLRAFSSGKNGENSERTKIEGGIIGEKQALKLEKSERDWRIQLGGKKNGEKGGAAKIQARVPLALLPTRSEFLREESSRRVLFKISAGGSRMFLLYMVAKVENENILERVRVYNRYNIRLRTRTRVRDVFV